MNTTTFMDDYMAMWNEPDAQRRAALVSELWAPDAINATATMEAVGHDAIVARVTRSFDAFVAAGHRFELDEPALIHHGAARVTWRMVTGDGTVAARGEEFLVLDQDGRIASDHQFPLGVAG
jgi:mannose-6-phosphate isomerase-like protein (cupin superfamily)